jgi:hypothetical protein
MSDVETVSVPTPGDRKKIVERYAGLFHDPSVHFPPIPGPELSSAMEKYASDVDPDAVLALVDNTVSGGAKEGLVLTGTHLYGKNWGAAPKRIELSDIKSAAAKGHLTVALGAALVAAGCGIAAAGVARS